MKMKWYLLLVIGGLIALSIYAVVTIPSYTQKGKTPLAWATDPNPQRTPQVEWFNKLYPDCFLSIDPDNTGVMKVVVQCAANMGPDLIDGINEDNIQLYIESGILMDVTDKARELGFGLDTLHPNVRPLVVAKVPDKDGKLVERQFAYPCNVYHQYLYYNKNLFDKLKIPYPPEDLTWDEYITLARKLTIYPTGNKDVPEVFGAAGASTSVIAWGKGGEFFNKWGTVSTVDSKAFVDAFKMYHDMLFKDDIEPSPAQKSGVTSQGGFASGYISWFAEGKVGMLWGARWMLIQFRQFISEQKQARAEYLKTHPNARPDEGPQVLRFGCVQVPRFKDAPRYTAYGARSTGINANGKNREKALDFLSFLAGPKYSEIVNEGADSKPGNVKYISMEQFRHPDYPEEEEAHAMSIKAMPFGKVIPRSPFVPTSVVDRVMNKVSSKIIADRNVSEKDIAIALRKAAEEINTTIARNIKRDKNLEKIYLRLLEQGAEPIKYKEIE